MTMIIDVESQEEPYAAMQEEGDDHDVTSKTDALIAAAIQEEQKKRKRIYCWIGLVSVVALLAVGIGIPVYMTQGSHSRSGSCTDDLSTLVGMDGNAAVQCLQGQYPQFQISTIPEGSAVTMDYRTDRIRIFTDSQGRVATTPGIG